MPVDESEQAIIQAIGAELRRARHSAGLSRRQLVERMKATVPVTTYACYEQGIRLCPIPRFIEICRALGVGAPELLALALQRLEVDLEQSGVQIDLHKIVRDQRDELRVLRRWASNRLKIRATTADPHEPAVVHLKWDVVKEMAALCDVTPERLSSYIQEFTPESAPRPS